MKILVVAGARPNFMKIAPLTRVLNQRNQIDQRNQINFKVVHTGQHYDYEMSQVFFGDLEISKPEYFLGVGSESHAVQTARIMI
ncbi:UDP-N-acetyl glucosamine 2-epimerase, partial [Candidatus Gottesmanbacteria bacterium]|nr:UDP-N-acetyl glucosamine 2-epimerase [Candidatus Gottesmanbacteria bacterium]